jgi:1-acyl-sn-glycerol-3-phosphate acyltransferase
LLKSSLLTLTYRISRITIHTTIGLVIAACVLPLIDSHTKLDVIKWWCRGLLRAFNIRVITYGNLPATDIKGVMFVANHISWSDIHALNSVIPLRFIAKSDIKSWPIFGYLVQKSGTLFIDRSKRQEAGRIVEATFESLLVGDNVCFFPEGTTTDGKQVLPFKSSVLQAAINANTLIWPVAIKYLRSDGSINSAMAYAGDTTLMESMHQVLMQRDPVIELHFLTPIQANQYDRRELSSTAYLAIKDKLDDGITKLYL